MIPDGPISIPTKLNRMGLSEVINHLLNRNISQKFEFLINNRILRQSLSKILILLNISTEKVLTIEYFPAESFEDESKGEFSFGFNLILLIDKTS
jgi:ribosome biogenesis protein YTM1